MIKRYKRGPATDYKSCCVGCINTILVLFGIVLLAYAGIFTRYNNEFKNFDSKTCYFNNGTIETDKVYLANEATFNIELEKIIRPTGYEEICNMFLQCARESVNITLCENNVLDKYNITQDYIETYCIKNEFKLVYPSPPTWAKISYVQDVEEQIEKIKSSDGFDCYINKNGKGVFYIYPTWQLVLLYLGGIFSMMYIISFCIFRYLHLKKIIKVSNIKELVDKSKA